VGLKLCKQNLFKVNKSKIKFYSGKRIKFFVAKFYYKVEFKEANKLEQKSSKKRHLITQIPLNYVCEIRVFLLIPFLHLIYLDIFINPF
jgi:hypothetical protein